VPSAILALVELHPGEALDRVERELRRGEEGLAVAAADPERAAHAAGEEEKPGTTLVEPGSRHRAVELIELRGAVLALLGQREDRLGVDRHVGLVAAPPALLEELIVVRDDPVVDPDDLAVADRVVVRGDGRMALRVVAHVDERLDGVGRDLDPIEQLARAGALLEHVDGTVRNPVRVPDGVGAALGDPGQQRLRRERPVDARRGAQAIAGNAAHTLPIVGWFPAITLPTRRIDSSEG
jgi:hypothetical protein